MFSKKWWIYLVAISFGAGSIAYACAGGDWDDYENDYSNIQKQKYVDTAFIPFLYNASSLFLSDEINGYNYKFNDKNTEDWVKYFNNTVPYALMDSLLHNTESVADNEPFVMKFRTLSNIDKKKAEKFLSFLQMAKLIEAYSTAEFNYWSYDENPKPAKADQWMRDEIETAYKNEKKDEFIKNRLWFQAMKANFYSDNPTNAITFFDKTASKQPRNYLYYRALGYVAGANAKLNNYALANYQYAQMFLHEPRLRGIAIYNFSPRSEVDFHEALVLCANKEEEIAMWTILGLYADPYRSLKEVYVIDPKHKNLELLGVGYLNQLEGSFNGEHIVDVNSYNAALKEDIDKDALAYINRMATSNNTSRPDLWYNIAGYLFMLNGDYDKADVSFVLSFNASKKDETYRNQHRILKYINNILRLNDITPADEKRLLEEVKWINSHVAYSGWESYYNAQNTTDDNYYLAAYKFGKAYISKLYGKKDDYVMQQLFSPNKQYYYSKTSQNNMLKLMNATNKTEWQKMALADYWFTKDDIYYLQGLNAFYNGDLQTAMQLIRKCEGGSNDFTLFGNPFNGKIKDCNDCDHAAKQSKKYNSASTLVTMMEMKEKIDKGEDVYNNANLLGNAYYNLSYYGNGRNFYAANKIMEASDMYISEEYADMLLSMAQVKKYYTMALNAATNDEQKAKMHYLLAKVERNSYYQKMYTKPNQDFSGYDYWYNDSDIDFKAWDNFKILKAKYDHTKYYKDVINECGYFKTYVKKYR